MKMEKTVTAIKISMDRFNRRLKTQLVKNRRKYLDGGVESQK